MCARAGRGVAGVFRWVSGESEWFRSGSQIVRSGSGVVNSWQRGAFTSKVFQESEETRNSDLGFPIKPYFINRITVRIPLTLDLE